jgi:predicted ArsR family transcriptional regulator
MRYDVGAVSIAKGHATEANILRALVGPRYITPSRVAERVGRAPNTVLGHLRRLEAVGMVEQNRVTTGKQWTRWRTTTKGEDHVSRLSASSVPSR